MRPAILDREYWIRRLKDTFWLKIWTFYQLFKCEYKKRPRITRFTCTLNQNRGLKHTARYMHLCSSRLSPNDKLNSNLKLFLVICGPRLGSFFYSITARQHFYFGMWPFDQFEFEAPVIIDHTLLNNGNVPMVPTFKPKFPIGINQNRIYWSTYL